jgi:hypothetical protein
MKIARAVFYNRVLCLDLPHFPHHLLKDTIFNKQIFKPKMSFLILSMNYFEKFSFLRNIRRKFVLHTSLTIYKYLFCVSEFSKLNRFCTVFVKFSIINFYFRIRPMWAELFVAYGRTDGRTAITNLIQALLKSV